MKPPEFWDDEFANYANWVWSLKDYIKKQSPDGSEVEQFVNNIPSLCLTADIANSLKHDGLDRRLRSGHRPVIGRAKYEIPQTGINSLRFGAQDVVIDAKPEETIVRIPITSEEGENLGDGFEILSEAVFSWETFLNQIGLINNP